MQSKEIGSRTPVAWHLTSAVEQKSEAWYAGFCKDSRPGLESTRTDSGTDIRENSQNSQIFPSRLFLTRCLTLLRNVI